MKTMGTSGGSKVFSGKVYKYFRGLFKTKAEAVKQAKLFRREGRLARVTYESYQGFRGVEHHYIVWVR